MSSIGWRTPSTARSAGSNMRSGRCASSAPRWRTSCARRWPRFAVRSSWPADAWSERRVQRSAFASQIEEIDRLTRLIDHILTLARAESGQIRLTRWRRSI